MANPKSRRPRPGRGLPPPPRQTPEEEAEDARLRRQLWRELQRLDLVIARKRARDERRRLGLEPEGVFTVCAASTCGPLPGDA